MSAGPEPYEIAIGEEALGDLRQRLTTTRWPELAGSLGWEYGADVDYLWELCAHWGRDYDWRATERRLNARSNFTWDGIHFWREGDGPGRLPILLIHFAAHEEPDLLAADLIEFLAEVEGR